MVPGSPGELDDLDAALACAEVGYPLLVKASAGGGGRGIRIAHDADELRRNSPSPSARRPAQAAFGSPAVYLERFIRQARHIEVQILGDGERAVHLFERECSLQRRQKVFEEAPSAALDGAQRQALRERRAPGAESRLSWRGHLEYLFDAHSGEFFFIEMNTRIQVEHPVSEMVTGIDLVRPCCASPPARRCPGARRTFA